MIESQQPLLAIKTLIAERSKELGLSRTEVIKRCGYSNISKGLRRLEQLCEGQFSGTVGLVQALPNALEVSPEVVTQAVEDTKRYFRETEEAALLASFVPHAIIVPERKIPQPIFVAAIIGVDKLLRVDFDLSEDPRTFVKQALDGVREKVGKCGQIPAFGKPVSVVVNYSPDRAVQYDLQGQPTMAFDRAYRPGQARLTVGKREFSLDALDAICCGR